MKPYIYSLTAVSLAGFASLVFCNPPARAEDAKPSPAQVQALIEDINAHKQLCDKVAKTRAALYQQCADEQATLLDRQKKLGVSDDTLNDKLKTRGWRWP